MGIKKKLGLGVASAALGLSLIGGGTFAYFNDTVTINNSLASGTLDLTVKPEYGSNPINFDLSNLKPGDEVLRNFVLDNTGTLAIKNVWFNVTASNFSGSTDLKSFLNQFEVDFYRVDKGTDGTFSSLTEIRPFKEDITTLGDLANSNDLTPYVSNTSLLNGDNTKLDLASAGMAVDPNEQELIRVAIKFKDNGNQNQYQNSSAKIQFNLEATQFGGQQVDNNRGNGYLKQNEFKTQIGNPSIDSTRQDSNVDVAD